MSAAVPVMSRVPTMACSAPPPSPVTLRIELVKNSMSKRARPLVSTVIVERDEREQRDHEGARSRAR